MGIIIERQAYDKTRYCRMGDGYIARGHPDFPSAQPTKILIHTMNNPHRRTTWHGACSYIATSVKIAADYAVGCEPNQVARFLVPRTHISYGAGLTIPGWGNGYVINIELHIDTPAGGPAAETQYTPALYTNLTGLVLELCQVYPIGDLRTHMRTHRAVARPYGRKVDPSGWNNEDFATYRALLQLKRTLGR